MTFRVSHAAALALAGALTIAAITPSSADSRWGYAGGGFAAGAVVGAAAANANASYYGPGYSGYAYAPYGYAYAPAPGYYGSSLNTYGHAPVYDPENAQDPDPRIGGSFKSNGSGKD